MSKRACQSPGVIHVSALESGNGSDGDPEAYYNGYGYPDFAWHACACVVG